MASAGNGGFETICTIQLGIFRLAARTSLDLKSSLSKDYTMHDIFEQESGKEIVTRNSPAHETNHSTALVVWLTCIKLQAVTT